MKKLLTFLFFFLLSMMLFSVTAFAYIDPSAMTYIIQIIAGMVIAAGAAFGFYWRRIKRAFSKRKSSSAAFDDRDYDMIDEDDDEGYGDYDIDSADDAYDNMSDITPSFVHTEQAHTIPAASSSVRQEIDLSVTNDIKPDKYDEVGGQAGLAAENRELRRLLAEEKEKVEILKKSLYICMQSRS